jgi:RNA polymerase sigma factor (sigma-70 family)
MPKLTPPEGLPDAGPEAGKRLRRYVFRLHRYVLRQIGRRAEAEDLTQEIFERYLRAEKSKIRDPESFLFGIAKHVVTDALMAGARSRVTYDSDVVEDACETADHATADDVALRIGIQQDLEYGFARLKPTHQAVVLLIKRDGLSYEEAAQRMGLTKSTVRSYLEEARAQLKIVLNHRNGG